VQQVYQRTQDFDANFKQTLTRKYHGSATRFGHVYLSKPGRMRWNYVDAKGRVTTQVISDGKTLWTYEPEDKQAFAANLKDQALPTAVRFLFGAAELSKEFDATVLASSPYMGPTLLALELVPKQASASVKKLVLGVNRTGYEVDKTVLYQQNGDVNEVVFTSVRRNTKLAADRFDFSPPPGTRVLRADAAGPAGATPAVPAATPAP
jgi:outer membrane lipoprotein carrier protein